MKVLIGTLQKGLQGGVYVTEAPFVAEIRKAAEVFLFNFGRKVGIQTFRQRTFSLMVDLTHYIRELFKVKPDMVHLNSAFDKRALLRDIWYVLLSRMFGFPLFIKYHGSDAHLLTDRSLFWSSLMKLCVRQASGIGVLSSEEKDNFLKAGFNKDTIFVVKNTVDYAKFQSTSAGRSDDRTKLLFISRLIPSKGLLNVIRAFAIVLRTSKNLELVCVGDGPDLPKARDLTRKLGIDQNVVFTGLVSEEETLKYYLCSTMLVFPTTHGEGFSMVIFQSVAAGLPIITTRIRAAADYLTEPDNCLWVQPRDPDLLAQKISYLLDHPEVMAKMSQNNRQLAQEFAAEVTTTEYFQIYKSLAARRNS